MKKLLKSPIFRGLIKSLPFGIGSLFGGVMEETAKSKEGEITREELIPLVIKLVIYGALIYLAIDGTITWEDAERAKDVVN